MSLRSIFGRIKSNIAEGVNAVITTGALKPLSGAVGLGVVAYNSVFPVPGGTVALIEDRRGNLRPHVYDSSQVVLHWPFYQYPILIRATPTKKNLNNVYTTRDQKSIEVNY
eukprot:Selendium_serpulae@DN5131_c0_g1_i1.p1